MEPFPPNAHGPPSPPQRLPQVPPHYPDASAMKLTRGHSCRLCQSRKVRCDKNKPCANCVKAGVECKVVPPQPPRRRKKKPQEKDLIDRLKKYESLLSQHGVAFESLGTRYKTTAEDAIDELDELEEGVSGLKTSPSAAGESDAGQGLFKWFPFQKEFRAAEKMLTGDSSDEEEFEGSTIHHAFDTMFSNQDAFPFTVGGSSASVTDMHPPAIHIFQLWQIYLNNVNPLLKITHAPTLQPQIIEAGANLAKIPPGLEALMFAIYFAAVTSLPEEECHSTLNDDKQVLLSKYHLATQQALCNVGFMRTTDFSVLQALFLHLLCIRQFVDPRSLFCLIGIAVRIAERLGLHRDGAQFGLPPFEAEQRRRLWWQLIIFDKRIAEVTGSTITALSNSACDTKMPANVNDADIYINAKDAPAPVVGVTEMVFALTRIELTTAASPNSMRPAAPVGKPRLKFSPSPSAPDVFTNMAQQNLPGNLDSYCNYIENVYLKHCDPKIPLHFFTLMLSRQGLCKLRVISALIRTINGETFSEAERESVFIDSIQMIEYDNLVLAADQLKGFIWYTHLLFPMPAYIYMVNELRQRKTGALVERAWGTIVENHDRRGFIKKNLRSPIHISFGTLFVKAWDVRAAAELENGRQVEAPKFITMLKANHAKANKQRMKEAQKRQNSQSGGGAAVSGNMWAKSQPTVTSQAGPGGVPAFDNASIYSGSSDTYEVAGGALEGQQPVQDVDFGQMDWSYLVQEFSGGFGEFNPLFTPEGQGNPQMNNHIFR